MFSIYSHVHGRLNGGSQPPSPDSNGQPTTPMPSLPNPKAIESTVNSTPSPNSSATRTRPKRKSSLVLPAQLENDEEDRITEAPASDDIQAASSPRFGGWILDALKKEFDPTQSVPQLNQSTSAAKTCAVKMAGKDKICNNHRAFLLNIRRSLRGRIIGRCPVGDKSQKSTRYLSPYTWDELQETFNRPRRSADAAAPATPQILSGSQSGSSAKKRGSGKAERKTQQQQTKSISIRRNSSRNRSGNRLGIARKSRGPSFSKVNMVTDMLQDPQSPDKDIAPLVSTWVKKLATKADKLERTIEEKDISIIRLEGEHERLETKNMNLHTKIERLESRLSRLEPASNTFQDEVSALKAQVQQITADKELETQKVENLNNQLSAMVRQLMTNKKEHENSMSRQASTAGAEAELKDLKAKHEALNQFAMDVVNHGGIFASNNLGEFGTALLKLKEHMEQ